MSDFAVIRDRLQSGHVQRCSLQWRSIGFHNKCLESDALNDHHPISADQRPAEAAGVSRTAILVLGMHASGTSAFARIAQLLGCDLPRIPEQLGAGNGAAHAEANAVAAFNDRLLASAGSRWDDWLPLNEGWSKSAVRGAYLIQAQQVIQAEFDASPLFLIEDPRICRLVPFWLEVFESLGIRPIIAFPNYNPYAICRSLSEHHSIQEGFGLLLWLRHILEAEAATRRIPRFFFDQDQLLADWTDVVGSFEASTDFLFPGRSVPAETQISVYLTDEAQCLRESGNKSLSAASPAWVHETYAIMQSWCRAGERSDDLDRLDAMRADFDAASPSFSRLITSGLGVDGELGMAEITQTFAKARDDLVQRLDTANAELEELRDERESTIQARAELLKANSEFAKMRDDHEAATQAHARLGEELAAASDEVRRLKDELAEKDSALRQRQEEATQAWAEANFERQLRERTDAELKRAISQNEQLIDRFSEFEGRLRADAENLVTTRIRARAAEDAISELRQEYSEEIERRDAELERLRSRMSRADSELAQLTMLYAESQSRLGELEQPAAEQVGPGDPGEPGEQVGSPSGFQAEVATPANDAPHKVLPNAVEWMREATELLRQGPAWWAFLPGQVRRKHERALLEANGLFDSAAYLARNSDVAREGIDPLVHFMKHGIFEGRKW